jgi:hypothetical protein
MRIATCRHQNRHALGRLSPDGRVLGPADTAVRCWVTGQLRPDADTRARIKTAGIGVLENPVAAFREAA